MQHPEPKCPRSRAITNLTAVFLLSASLSAAEKWRMQYFYDKDESAVAFTDLQCPSAKRCIASGILQEGKRDQGVVVVTADGGANWTLEDVKEHPISLFFLNEQKGWMVTDRGIWETVETGRTWKKIKDQKELARVYFLDEKHGFAVGAAKTVLETLDGGRNWTPVSEADKAPTSADNTVYHWIAFADPKHGIIIGSWELPPTPGEVPDWMLPERARRRHQFPSVTILLQTTDGGKTWTLTSTSLEGALTKFLYGAPGEGFALLQFPDSAQRAAELFRMDLDTKKNTSVYQDPMRPARDFAVLPDGEIIVAAVEKPGKANNLPIPGKLKMMRSGSLKTWLNMDVDYRAVAGRAILATPDSNNMWVATDTGMILKLQP